MAGEPGLVTARQHVPHHATDPTLCVGRTLHRIEQQREPPSRERCDGVGVLIDPVVVLLHIVLQLARVDRFF